mgnify:CR=1 FL=1
MSKTNDVSQPTAEQPVCPGMLIHGSHEITFTYSNWRGEIARRRVGVCSIWFGSTEWHPGDQWLLHGIDLDKMEARDFAMKDMWDVRYTWPNKYDCPAGRAAQALRTPRQ